MNTIAISSLHNAPPIGIQGENRRHGRWGRLAWDRYQFETYWEAAGMLLDDRKTEEAFENIFADTTGPVNSAVFIGDREDALQGYLWVISIDNERDAKNFLTTWIDRIKMDGYWASGDDSAYDYAPDEAHMIFQIASHYNLHDLYREFYQWAHDRWYHDDKDEFHAGFPAPTVAS